MSKKLLSEAQVRRFMGLAGIKPVNEMAYKHDDEKKMREGEELEEMRAKKDDELDEMRGSMKKDEEQHEVMRGSMKKDDEMREAEEPKMDMDDKGGDADVEMDEEDLADVKSALDTLQDKLAPLLDQAEAEAGEEDDMEMDAKEPEMDLDASEPKDDEDEMDMMEAELAEINMELTEEEIVNEVARRVAKRIVEAKRAHKKMNEALGRRSKK